MNFNEFVINTLFIFFILFLIHTKYGNCVDVNTTSGVVRGQTVHILDTNIDQFLNIPYAVPPVGELRFAKPVPITKPSPGILDGTKIGKKCLQLPPHLNQMSEDCLVLNVWTSGLGDLKPVMFWIHGGGLAGGSSFEEEYNGTVLATHHVVIVSTNYRLGSLGFLYGGREDAPGNVGFYDQLLALKWVRDNIHAFGGDRDQITIFGESAGSESVSAHILSPLSKGLFKRAIMESGARLYNKDRDVLNTTEALLEAKQMARLMNCSESEDWLKCLRKADGMAVINLDNALIVSVLGTEFLPISAQKAFETKKFNSDIDLLAGVVRNEGSSFVPYVVKHPLNITLEDFTNGIKELDLIFHGVDVKKVTDFYLQNVNTSSPVAMHWAVGDLSGDLMLTCPTYLFAKQFAITVKEWQRVYFYELLYGSKRFSQIIGCDQKTEGICHAEDIPFVFGLPYIYEKDYEPEDMFFSREVMKMWTKFAKDGHQDEEWPQLLNNDGVDGVPLVKGLDPTNMTLVLSDPFHRTCDGIWSTYFL